MTGFEMTSNHDTLFAPITFANGLTLRNRIAMAPMTTWSGNSDGTVSDAEIDYYRRRVNGAGLVITGCTHVQANGIGFTDEFAAWDDRFLPGLTRLAQAAKSGGAFAVLQIFHAGNKATPELIPGGDVVSASAVEIEAGPYNGALTPRALTHDEILDVIRAFGEATRRAIEAGFDGIELHGAHGFLLQNFLSPHFNKRTDEWGGSLENRMRFPLAVVGEVRRVIEVYAHRPFLLGYRISHQEAGEGGLRIGDALALTDRLIDFGIDYIHASLGIILGAKPGGETGYKTTAEIVVDHAAGRVPVIAAGQIVTPERAASALQLGLSLVAVGRGLVIDPDWVELAEAGRSDRIETTLNPAKLSELAIPDKLWSEIEARAGWFQIQEVEKAKTHG
jgi:2,4-dienoyl-CoA reductase-like NADH-dependent reductase (Old Yellow Enzyme family)